MPADADPPPVLALVRDLIFASKIRATAGALGTTVVILRDPAQIQSQSGRRVIVDLNESGMLDAAVAWKRATGGEIVGFVSHVETETIAQATEQGFDRVLPRSQFVQMLPDLLR